ncbi:MAG: ABC transporter ATP-binding protein [Balneolaceae bacterium]
MVQLKATSLEKYFGRKQVFTGLTFSFEAAVIGIAGANGAGKSTLLKCLTGLLKPTSGSVEWKLKDAALTPKNLKRHLGFTAPYIQLYEELTVNENLQFIVDLQNGNPAVSIPALLNRFEAGELSQHTYGTLSTGQQQRIKLAAAIIHQPEILVLDEPGSNLDAKGKTAVRALISEFRQYHKMVLLASNQPDELDLCDDILNLNHN